MLVKEIILKSKDLDKEIILKFKDLNKSYDENENDFSIVQHLCFFDTDGFYKNMPICEAEMRL